jgi:coenzyme F420-0:L-glutamate ligase/coenzyme F420-1:gamma-L-glutamate ligase
MAGKRQLTLTALGGIGEIEAGADLARLLTDALGRASLELEPGDVIVIAQKIVSKAEGRRVALAEVTPSARAAELAVVTAKDARLVELMLRESSAVLRAKRDVLILEHRLGFVMAGAGVDQSNVPHAGGACALLLPEDPDASARRLRQTLGALTGVMPGVIVNDSFGRAWRNGVTGVAIGVAGVPALVDLRGRPDREGRPLEVTQVAAADELAAAASVLMGQADEGVPAVLVRGFPYGAGDGAARDLVRPRADDLFR